MSISIETIGILVTIVAIAVGGGVYVGQLKERLDRLDSEQIAEYKIELKKHVDEELENVLGDDKLPIGSILASAAEPDVMLNYAPNWRLADGRPVERDWEYEGIDGQLPDLRNVFLRGMSQDGSRVVGSREEYATAEPRNGFSIDVSESGGHMHKYERDERTVEVGPAPSRADARNDRRETSMTGKSGVHMHPIELTGWDKETRPINVAVYFYIKVKQVRQMGARGSTTDT